jgi:uncharacterized protein YgiM (DUF1202 family)
MAPACNGVNVRTSPSTSASVKVQLSTGAAVTVTGSVSGSSWGTYCPDWKSGSTWYTISAVNGSSVSSLYGVSVLYAATGVLVATGPSVADPAPPPPTTSTGAPACSSINLRSGTSTSNGIVAQLVPGDTATIDATLGGGSWSTICPTSKSGSTWYRISAVNGQSVSSRYGVSVVYAATGVIDIVTAPAPAPTPTPPPTSTYLPACNGINVRTSASTSGSIAVRLFLGASVTVSGTVSGGAWSTTCPTAKSGSGWYKITAINGTPVSSLYGVSVLYAATGVLDPQ